MVIQGSAVQTTQRMSKLELFFWGQIKRGFLQKAEHHLEVAGTVCFPPTSETGFDSVINPTPPILAHHYVHCQGN